MRWSGCTRRALPPIRSHGDVCRADGSGPARGGALVPTEARRARLIAWPRPGRASRQFQPLERDCLLASRALAALRWAMRPRANLIGSSIVIVEPRLGIGMAPMMGVGARVEQIVEAGDAAAGLAGRFFQFQGKRSASRAAGRSVDPAVGRGPGCSPICGHDELRCVRAWRPRRRPGGPQVSTFHINLKCC